MKKLLVNNKNELLRICLYSLLAIGCVFAVAQFLPQSIFCNDLFQTGTEALNTVQDKLVALSQAIFPVALIIVLLLMATTHNDKKIGLYKTILVTIIVVEALIFIVNRGLIIDLIKGLVGVD